MPERETNFEVCSGVIHFTVYAVIAMLDFSLQVFVGVYAYVCVCACIRFAGLGERVLVLSVGMTINTHFSEGSCYL